MTFLTDRASFSIRQYKIEKKKSTHGKVNNCYLLEVFKIIFMSNRSWGAMAVIYKGFLIGKTNGLFFPLQGIMIMTDVSPESLRIWVVTYRTFLFFCFFSIGV